MSDARVAKRLAELHPAQPARRDIASHHGVDRARTLIAPFGAGG